MQYLKLVILSFTLPGKNFVCHFASFAHNANFKFHKETNYHFLLQILFTVNTILEDIMIMLRKILFPKI